MTTKLNDQFTEKELYRIAGIAKSIGLDDVEEAMKEISEDGNNGRHRILIQNGSEKVGGLVLRYLLGVILALAELCKSKDEQIKYWKDINYSGEEKTKDTVVKIAKACESVKKNDYQDCVNILGNLLHQEDELYI